jgi:hypothetical protein
MRISILVVLIAAAVAAASAAPGVTAPCTAGNLTAVFAVVPGSAGAGNIVYSLRLTNIADHGCLVKGLLGLRLLNARGNALPTRVTVTDPAQVPRVRDVLAAHRWGNYGNARFSPDVPGVGEQTIGRCEPVAHRLRIGLPNGGHVIAPIKPPTSVCEHGSMSLTVQVWAHG